MYYLQLLFAQREKYFFDDNDKYMILNNEGWCIGIYKEGDFLGPITVRYNNQIIIDYMVIPWLRFDTNTAKGIPQPTYYIPGDSRINNDGKICDGDWCRIVYGDWRYLYEEFDVIIDYSNNEQDASYRVTFSFNVMMDDDNPKVSTRMTIFNKNTENNFAHDTRHAMIVDVAIDNGEEKDAFMFYNTNPQFEDGTDISLYEFPETECEINYQSGADASTFIVFEYSSGQQFGTEEDAESISMYSSEVNAGMKLDFFALKHHGRDSVNGHTVGTLGDSDSNINQEVLIDENNEGTDVFMIYEFYWNDPTNDNPPMFFWDFYTQFRTSISFKQALVMHLI